jgi:LacI family transcriptional regulator
VSRVINGGPVAPATRERVLAAIEHARYRPNLAARGLASGRTGVVGVVMHEDAGRLFHDPYFSRLLEGMSDALASQATAMMLWLGNRSKEETLDRILGIGLLDGVIVTANQLADPLVDGLLASSLPTVLVGHRRSDRTASYVDVDHVHAAETVTAHLIKIGRRRIGHITGTRGTVAGEDRIAGYRQALTRAGMAAQALIAEGDFNERSGADAARHLLGQSVDAIFCANDATAKGALEAIRAAGLRVPEDVALAGFDDVEFASQLDPPLTTIRQGVREQGVEAAQAVFQLLRDPEGGPCRVILPTELVIRRSTVGGLAAP